MILGVERLLELVKSINLVENLCERELTNPEGAGFDLRLGEVYEISGDGFLGVEERQTPSATLIAKHDETKAEKDNYFIFEPGKYYLVKTMERVNTPSNLTGAIFSRTTLFRSGLSLIVGQDAPGFCGELTFGICNLGKSNIKISFGARIAHIMFHEILGEGNSYRGQWKNGRVSAETIETQV